MYLGGGGGGWIKKKGKSQNLKVHTVHSCFLLRVASGLINAKARLVRFTVAPER